jgi:hypothetical protein
VSSIAVPDCDSYFDELNTDRDHTFAVTCPCCGRDGMVYWRKLNYGMCRVMIDMARLCRRLGRPDGAWVHVDELFGRGVQKHRDWVMTRHWGLTQPMDKRTAEENAQGFWRLTQNGYRFLRGQIRVPKHGAFYQNAPIRWDTVGVYIEQAVDEKFDYRGLMEGLFE